MIITLVNANFSSSNIGTLSTWTISRSLGTGATYSGPNYVDKDAALSATVTIADGYELGTAGVTVTMGGVAQESAATVDGNVITISIAAVTGIVMIKVPTINSATGEDTTNPDEGGDTTTTYTDITSKLTFNDNVIISGADGTVDTNTTEWCHTPYGAVDLTAYQGGKLRITLPTMPTIPSNLGIAFYDSSKTFISGKIASTTSSYGYETVELTIPTNATSMRSTWYMSSNSNYNSSWAFKCEIATASSSSSGGSSSGESGNLTSLFTWTDAAGINATTGATDSSVEWMYSNYVDVSSYSSLEIATIWSITTSTTTKGLAFYDSNKTYISGVTNNTKATTMTYEIRTISVPSNAVYIRASWASTNNSAYNDNLVISNFSCNGIA